jgi:hypothetical protein
MADVRIFLDKTAAQARNMRGGLPPRRPATWPALCSEIKEERAAISRKRGTFAEEGGSWRGAGRVDAGGV